MCCSHCLWRNVEASCHKHFFVVSRYQHRHLLPAISATTCGTVVRWHHIDNTWPVAALTARSEARYRLRIAISAYPTCIRCLLGGFRLEYYHAIWYWKTRMVWLPDGEIILKIPLFVLTECTNVTDRQTHTQTHPAWWHRPRLHSTVWQKMTGWSSILVRT